MTRLETIDAMANFIEREFPGQTLDSARKVFKEHQGKIFTWKKIFYVRAPQRTDESVQYYCKIELNLIERITRAISLCFGHDTIADNPKYATELIDGNVYKKMLSKNPCASTTLIDENDAVFTAKMVNFDAVTRRKFISSSYEDETAYRWGILAHINNRILLDAYKFEVPHVNLQVKIPRTVDRSDTEKLLAELKNHGFFKAYKIENDRLNLSLQSKVSDGWQAF